MTEEYFGVLERLSVSEKRIENMKTLLATYPIVTHVRPGTIPTSSRDDDDNFVLATAIAGKAKFLITLDRDLLDISDLEKKKFKFEILKPADFLRRVEEL